MENVLNIMEKLNMIEYGFPSKDGDNLINNTEKWDREFGAFYYLQTPDELLKSKIGVCFEQVELERYLFGKENIEFNTYFIFAKEGDNIPSHTFLTFKMNNKYYWFEHSWNKYQGIHEYNSINELLVDVKEKFILSNQYLSSNAVTYMYRYDKPKSHISCDEFYKYAEEQELVEDI